MKNDLLYYATTGWFALATWVGSNGVIELLIGEVWRAAALACIALAAVAQGLAARKAVLSALPSKDTQ